MSSKILQLLIAMTLLLAFWPFPHVTQSSQVLSPSRDGQCCDVVLLLSFFVRWDCPRQGEERDISPEATLTQRIKTFLFYFWFWSWEYEFWFLCSGLSPLWDKMQKGESKELLSGCTEKTQHKQKLRKVIPPMCKQCYFALFLCTYLVHNHVHITLMLYEISRAWHWVLPACDVSWTGWHLAGVTHVVRQRNQDSHPGNHLNQHANPPGSLPVARQRQDKMNVDEWPLRSPNIVWLFLYFGCMFVVHNAF